MIEVSATAFAVDPAGAPSCSAGWLSCVIAVALLAGCGNGEADHLSLQSDGGAPALSPGEHAVGEAMVATERGSYRVGLRPEAEPLAIGQLHAWLVRIEDAHGQPFTPSKLVFSAGMRQHGHGLATQPRVTQQLSPGELRVEGVKFHMSGRWQIAIELDGPAGADRVAFAVTLEP